MSYVVSYFTCELKAVIQKPFSLAFTQIEVGRVKILFFVAYIKKSLELRNAIPIQRIDLRNHLPDSMKS